MTGKMRDIIEFLKGRTEFTSPAEIGQFFGRASGRNLHSAWASPACLRLVKSGILERNSRGWYRIKEAAEGRKEDGK